MAANLIVPIFLPHAGCPHRCVFCNQAVITADAARKYDGATLEYQVRLFRSTWKKAAPARIQLAFFGGNFLGQSSRQVTELLQAGERLAAQGLIHGIRFSTRPDTIDSQTLNLIAPYPISTVELGVQSMDDRVLSASRRGHSAADTRKAMALLKQAGYEIGLQMMTGLPGDDDAGSLATGRQIAALAPDFVRIYPTVVIAGSKLETWYRSGSYRVVSLDNTISLVKGLYQMFTVQGIRVIRMGLQASETLGSDGGIVAGPYHPAFGHLVLCEMFLDKAVAAIENLDIFERALEFRIHPQNTSRLRGLHNQNVEKLKKRYQLQRLIIRSDPACPVDDVIVHPV